MADAARRFAGNLDAVGAEARRARLKGVGLMLAALACFCCLDTTAKILNGRMDTVQVVWARYVFHFLLTLPFINPWNTPGLMRTARPGLQVGRALMLLACTACNFVALIFLQLDETISITFTTPFLVAILAGPILGEWVGPKRMAAILVGFLGVLIVTRPGLGGLHWAAGIAFLGCVAYALYLVSTRVLARHDPTTTTLFYSGLVGVVVMTPAAPFFWTWPSAVDWGLMAMLGALGGLGHFLLIAAYRLAPAAVLAPFIYCQLIGMIALGYVVFGDVPTGWTLAGASVVIASGLYLLMRERRTKPVAATIARPD
ncbi:DMT family transporter [Methylopila henanensis]|uniref:DMT family transporter n=1 Tax=Methylopila henanensis TaxID=873516 RepID=A0ABW4K7Y4_9HYPH